MEKHVVIIKMEKAIQEAYHPKGMSVHDGMVKVPACHVDWLLKKIVSLEKDLININILAESQLKHHRCTLYAKPSNCLVDNDESCGFKETDTCICIYYNKCECNVCKIAREIANKN